MTTTTNIGRSSEPRTSEPRIRGARRPTRRHQRGSVLVLTLLVCMILLGLGLSAMWLSSESGKVSANVTLRAEAYYAAQSALERARGILLAATSWDPMLAGCPGGTWNASTHVEELGSGAGRGRVLCAGTVPLYQVKLFDKQVGVPSVSSGQVGTLNTVQYTIWIRNDDEEGGAGNLTDANTRVIVRAEGVGRGNLGFVALEQIVGRGAGSVLKEAAYSQAGMGPTGANSGKAQLTN